MVGAGAGFNEAQQMIFQGTHQTVYSFDIPVTLDEHTIRLSPRVGGGQILNAFSLHLDPEPSTLTETLDAEGNALQRCWFAGPTDHLTIETRFSVENFRSNPFDFIPAEAAVIPMRLKLPQAPLLGPALKGGGHPAVQKLALQLADRCGGGAGAYVLLATRWIYDYIRYESRVDGEPRPAAETLRRRCGACRDTAVLLMSLCRAMAVPARFVSGYQEGTPEMEQHDLHAWAEAWIPGGGWRGFDPTHGLAVADRHIPVAASVDPLLTAPVSGVFFSRDAKAKIPEHHIKMAVS